MAKKKAKKRGCGSTTGKKLYVVDNNGKLTVTKCKGKAKKTLTKCRKRIKRLGRGACQMRPVMKAHKVRVARGQGRIRRGKR